MAYAIKAFDGMFHDAIHKYELMAEHVYKTLKGRKYLIVLDDMWSTKAWDDLKRLFPDDHNGSRIILTTRLSDVAAYADSSSPLYEMHFLDVSQSWNLLRQKVFGNRYCPPGLENIGKNIARSCSGLPLALVVVAGLLSTVSQTRDSWQNIAENVSLAITENDEQLAKILSLSYSHLPHHLRTCFLCLGVFPEDEEINVSKLIKLWIAEGFVKPSISKNFEEGAEEYLEDLVKRSLVLVTKRRSNGKIKTCSVHDLVRDLCIRKAREEEFLLYVRDRYVNKMHPISGKDWRRLSIPRPSLTSPHIYGPEVRTVFFFQHFHRFLDSLNMFRLLRVLDAVKETMREFPAELLELIHLRYLGLTYMHEANFDIPASIVKLQNLQTFFICPYKRYWTVKSRVRFPLEVWGMLELRHLGFFMLDLFRDPCARYFAPLRNLQSLAVATDLKFTESIAKMIPNLKKLGVFYNGDGITNCGGYHLHNLVHLHQLENLKLCVKKHHWEPVPLWEKLVFPMTLNKLTLRGCSFRSQDVAIIGSLPNLEVLKLRHCSYWDGKWETTEGEFSRLKYLQIIGTNLREWITESSHFPILNCLRIGYCKNLPEIPGDIGDIPTLEMIEVNICDPSLVDSAKQIKEEQESFGNDSLQIRFANYYCYNF